VALQECIKNTDMKKVIIGLFCAAYSTLLSAQGLWEMPACAWTGELGDRPFYSNIKYIGGSKPGTVTKKGMPVGGIGTEQNFFDSWKNTI
jgi:hypothetical protein